MTVGVSPTWTAIILTILVPAITLGGLQSIANAASKIVPAMAVIYFVSTVGVLAYFANQIPMAIEDHPFPTHSPAQQQPAASQEQA